MVLPAVLRDPALDPGQALWRARDGCRDRRAVLPALARPFAGPLRHLPTGLQMVLLDAGLRLRHADVHRQESAGLVLAALRPACYAGRRISEDRCRAGC